MDKHKNVLRVYFDGSCYLCAHEIEIYRAKDTENRLEMVDISAPAFDAKLEGVSSKEVRRVFHVRDKDGNILKGVNAFVAIWRELGVLGLLVRLSEYQLFKCVMDLAYSAFAVVRPLLQKRKKCETGVCEL